MDDSPKPDPFERRVRFGCGFVFGGVSAFGYLVFWFNVAAFTGSMWATVAGVAIVSGFLAVCFGNKFFGWWV